MNIDSQFTSFFMGAVGIIIGTLATVGTGYFFHKKLIATAITASKERVRQAKEQLILIVEYYVINHAPVNKGTLLSIIPACERNFSVTLEKECTPVSLLQDVAYRIQCSTHIDSQKKISYQEAIDELIKEFTKSEKYPHTTDEELLEKLIALIPKDKSEAARELIENHQKIMEQRVTIRSINEILQSSTHHSERIFKQVLLSILLALLALIMSFAVLPFDELSDFLDSIINIFLSSKEQKIQ